MKISVLIFALLLMPLTAISAEQQIQLNDKSGQVIVLRQLTNLLVPSVAPPNRVCISPNGEQASLLQQITNPTAQVVWLRIQVTTGVCTGAMGWINADSARAIQ